MRSCASYEGFKPTTKKTANIPTGAPVPEIIDTVFAKTSPIRSFSMTEYERFGRGSLNSGTGNISGLASIGFKTIQRSSDWRNF